MDFFRTYRRHLLVGGVLLAALLFYSLNLKESGHANAFERSVLTLAAPLQGVISRCSSYLGGVWSNYIDLVNVRQENRQLRESIARLNTGLLQSREAVLTNDGLQRLLDLKNSLQVPARAASIIGEDPAPWFRTLLVDRGEVDGIREGMPVVASEGVVGQVVKVAPGSARVLLLTDHACAIAATVQRSRARGVVRGRGGGLCALEFAAKEDDVKVGDMVISSGMGGVFPKGLPIGEVTMVRKGEFGIFQTIDIRPVARISRLEEVLILLTPSGV